MSHFSTTVHGDGAIEVEYWPGRTVSGIETSPAVNIILGFASGCLHLSIEHARSLLEALPGVLAEHDAAVTAGESASSTEAA
ncbi:hypothetical protein ABZV91_15770 [Nocardia sp. NPDC004568]|uniref:hypothetical protein n=1 Tax=Nocardia sp. NPDC004568 TaxID=3154551 RepID=UPI0033BBB776